MFTRCDCIARSVSLSWNSCSNFKLTAWPGPTKTNTLKQKETLAKLLSPSSPSTSSTLPHTHTQRAHTWNKEKKIKKSFSSKVSISRFCWVKSLDTFRHVLFYYSQIPRSDLLARFLSLCLSRLMYLLCGNCVNERNFYRISFSSYFHTQRLRRHRHRHRHRAPP